jgi:CPA2 family monovalent cation:H+ antiporter-2
MLAPVLRDIAVLLLIGVAVVFLFHRLRLPALVGFLFAGVIAGPHGLGLIRHPGEVETLAEIGVVLLMFTIGLESPLEGLGQIRRLLLTAGGVQVLGTIALVAGAAALAGVAQPQAIFLGMLVALSSTAIVLKIIGDRGELEAPHGRLSIAILIFQDLCVVPMMLVAPLLAGGAVQGPQILLVLGQAVLVVVLAVFVARRIMPRLLALAASTRSREVFVLTVILVCIGTAGVVERIGLSLALGAFIAGVVISESEYSHQALSDILPFRDTLASLFFLSAGMLLDLRAVLSAPGLVLGGVVLTLAAKAVVTGVAVLATGYPLRIAITTGLALAQIGEFSFVLAQEGLDLGLLPETLRQPFLTGAVLSMAATPFLIAAGVRLGSRLSGLRAPREGKLAGQLRAGGTPVKLEGHTIIVGFGLNGRNLARVLSQAGIPFVAIDMNPRTVAEERRAGVPIVYGDACQAAVLEEIGVRAARVVVIAISDVASTRRATELARRLNPEANIIIRTRYVQEVEPLVEYGATEIVPEEFETSIEIFSRVLRIYLVPGDVIEEQIHAVRQDGYVMLRFRELPGVSLVGTMAGLRTEILRIEPGSPLAGKTLAESQLRSSTGAAVVAIKRGDQATANPVPETLLEAGDVVLLLGTQEQIAAGTPLFRAPTPNSATTPAGGG